MENIKLYKDGNRLVIVVENCGDAEEQILSKMIGAVTSDTKSIKDLSNVDTPSNTPNVSTNIETSKEQKEKTFTFGKHKGKTPTEVVKELGRFKSFMFFKTLTSIYDKDLKASVDEKIKAYNDSILKPLLDKVEKASYDDMIVFFNNFKPLFEKELNMEVNDMQYTNIEELLSYEDDNSRQALYRKYIEKIM